MIASKQPQVVYSTFMRFTFKAARCYYQITDDLRMALLISRKDRQGNEQKVMELYSRTVISHPKLSLYPLQSEITQLTSQHRACHLSCFLFTQWNVHRGVAQGTLLYSCTFLSSRPVWCKLFTEIPKNTMCSTSYCMQTNWVHSHHRYLLLELKKLEKEQPTYRPSHHFPYKGPAKLIQIQEQIWCVCFQTTAGQMLWVNRVGEE